MADYGTRVLLVDDDPSMRMLLAAVVRAHPGVMLAGAVDTGRAALEEAAGAEIVLLDHQLPDRAGLEVLSALRARPDPPSVIMVTAHGSESIAAAALRGGAEDYLVKDGSLKELLPQVLERTRRHRALRAALAAAERDLVRAERLAAIGEMTVTLHHELNNPLMSASAEIELLLANGGLPPGQEQSLHSVQQSLERIRDIVRRSGELQEATATPYPGGLTMIDLGPSPQAMPNRGLAVVYIPDEELARITALLLRHCGFEVRRVAGVDVLQREARLIGVTLVVVAALSPGSAPLAGFVPDRHRDYTLLVLVAGDVTAARLAGADHAVAVPFDPGSFGDDLLSAMRA